MKNRLIKTVIALLFAACAAETAPAPKVWEPKTPSDTTPASKNVCVVEQGIEHQRNGDGHVYGIGSFHRYKVERDSSGLFQFFTAAKDYTEYHDFDVDGDGDPANDTVGCHPFSMDNALTMDAPFYDTTIGDQKFYGGCTVYHANTRRSGFTEDGMNDYEEGSSFQPRRNWTFFNENYDIFSPFRMYMVALWKKGDFMNGGDQYPVSFDEESKLAYLVMRYYMGVEGFRFVVRNGDRFYISEKTFHGSGTPLGDNGGVAHTIYPVKEKWAEYNPQAPYKIDFDPSKAVFKPVPFDNVTAFGWYLYKDQLISGYVGHKWYGFEANAVVHRPARPSENIEMSRVDNFYISKTEVPYELWRKVHRLKRSNTFVLQKNYTFDKYGDLGSMDYSASLGRLQDAFSQDEPVTDITLYDMLAWCNALSEQESKTPCYYIDPEFKEKFREVRRSMLYVEPFQLPKIYVNWAADGYRLPTAGEWAAAGQGPGVRDQKSDKTLPVGSGSPNAQGLYDLLGNVWEAVWTFGSVLDPSSNPDITVVGGDFLQSKNPEAVSASPWGDNPYNGSWNIGFRIVRREAGLSSAPSGAGPSAPVWQLTKNTKTAEDTARQAALPTIKRTPIPGEPFSLGTYEVSFAEWKQVFNWAVAKGFEFDHDGEMGSMAYWGWGADWTPGLHTPDEPVTGITHYDTLVWLNALSTLEGKTPIYYHDKEFTQPYKKSYRYRPLMIWLGEQVDLSSAKVIRYGWNENDPTFSKKDANGYRLPTIKEFNRLVYGGETKPSWKSSREKVAETAWLADTSGFRTHVRGKLNPNKFGLYDMAGNVSEWGDDIDVGKNKGCIAPRLGGGFFDLAVAQGDNNMAPDTTRGLMYSDVGFRVVIKNNTEGK